MPGYPGSDGVPVRSVMKYSNIYLKEINTQTKQPKKLKECQKVGRIKNLSIKIDTENSRRE